MNIEQLKIEAENLKLESTIYKIGGLLDKAVGYWINSENEVMALEIDNKSILLRKNGEFPIVEEIKSIEIFKNAGIKVKAEKSISYPSLDYIFEFGSENVKDWLDSKKWNKEWGYSNNFKEDSAQEYYKWWCKNYLLFQKDQKIIGASNCWINAWPEDDFPIQINPKSRHILTTIYQAEPYYEIYKIDDKLVGYERIT